MARIPARHGAAGPVAWSFADLAGPPGLVVRVALVLGFAALICLRMPEVVLHGRLWAEEGLVFYPRAATLPWRTALLMPHGGYLNLVANAAPMLARLVPLEAAPWVTTGVGLFFQCCPAILLVCSRDVWLRRPLPLLACLLVIATAPSAEEVWLQSLHSQFHLALCCALILALETRRGALRWFGAALLLLAPLCGPAAIMLVPLFLLRAAIDRSRPRLGQAAVLGLGAAIQLAVFYSREPNRSYGISAELFLCVIYLKHLVVPFLGLDVAARDAAAIQQRLADGLVPLKAMVTASGAIIALVAALVLRTRAASIWMFLAAGLLAWLSYFGALNGAAWLLLVGVDGRYVFLPEVLTGLVLVSLAAGRTTPRDWGVAWVARVAVAWLVVAGLRDVGRHDNFMFHGPDWSAEVARWRSDHAHPIAIWPEGWSMRLDRE